MMPETASIEPNPIPRGKWGPQVDAEVAKIVRDAIQGTDEPTETLLGSSALDESHSGNWFAGAVLATALKRSNVFFYKKWACKYLAEWRSTIAAACYRLASGMARTVIDAELRRIPVPDSVEDWIPYALTVDGERIADELDRPDPSEYVENQTVALRQTAISPPRSSPAAGQRETARLARDPSLSGVARP